MKLANNAKSILKTDIVSNSNSFLVQDGEGALFKYEVSGQILNEFVIFAEQVENKNVIKREAIRVKRDGDTFFIIERKCQDVVSNDTAIPKVRERKKFNFDSGVTQISMYINEENITEIDENIEYSNQIKAGTIKMNAGVTTLEVRKDDNSLGNINAKDVEVDGAGVGQPLGLPVLDENALIKQENLPVQDAKTEKILIRDLTPGERLRKLTQSSNANEDFSPTTNTTYQLKTGTVGQTFLTPDKAVFINKGINIVFGAYYGGGNKSFNFKVYDSVAKTNLLYTYGPFNGNETQNTTKNFPVDEGILKANTEYYFEIEVLDSYSSYYILLQTQNGDVYANGKMYINGVESVGNDINGFINYDFQDEIAGNRYIPFRKGFKENEDNSKIYESKNGDGGEIIGYFKGITDGFTDHKELHIGKMFDIYGNNIYGGVFTPETTTLNKAQFKVNNLGTGTGTLKIYNLDGSGNLDIIGGSLLEKTFPFTTTTQVPLDPATYSTGYQTTQKLLKTIICPRDSKGTFSWEHYNYATNTEVEIKINGKQVYFETIPYNRNWLLYQVNLDLKQGDIIELYERTVNASYDSRARNIALTGIVETMEVDFATTINVTVGTKYGYIIQNDLGDVSNKISIQGENEFLYNEVAQITTTLGTNTSGNYTLIETINDSGVKNVKLRAELKTGSTSYYSRLMLFQGGTQIAIIQSNSTTYNFQEISILVDFDNGPVEIGFNHSGSNGNTTVYAQNITLENLDMLQELYESTSGINSITKIKGGLYSMYISPQTTQVIDIIAKGILLSDEDLLQNKNYFIDSGNLTTNSNGTVLIGKHIGERKIVTGGEVGEVQSDVVYGTFSSTITMTISHNLGRKPKTIIASSEHTSSSQYSNNSHGSWSDSGVQKCVKSNYNEKGIVSGWIFHHGNSNNTNYRSYGKITDVTDSSITVEFIKESSGYGAYVLFTLF